MPFVANPTLVIGLGGTGLKVATFVKKSLLEANQNVPPPGMAILVLDTEKDIKFQAGGWGRKRGEFHATGPVAMEGGEYVPLVGNVFDLGKEIQGEQIEAAVMPEIRRGQPHRHMSSWFQARYYIEIAGVPPATWNLDVGAGRYRQFGRLGLLSKIERVKTMLSSSMRPIQSAGATKLYVHVVGSLVGGTGAALFADVAHLVKQLAREVGFTQSAVIFGHFVLTEGFRGTEDVKLSNDGVRADFDARCCAALRELTRLQGTTSARTGGYPLAYNPDGVGVMNARLEGAPYTWVYLYDGDRSNNRLSGLKIEEGLAPAIADGVAAYIDDRSAGAFCSHSVNYNAYYSAYNIPPGTVTYGSVGTYTIELPIYHIVEGWAHDLAREALDVLLDPKGRDGDPETGVPVDLWANHPGMPKKVRDETTATGGGAEVKPDARVEGWLQTEPTRLVAKLAEWARLGRRTATQRQQAVDAVLGLDAAAWQGVLAETSDPRWQGYVDEARSELEASLKDRDKPKYYVDHDQGGGTDEERATNLQQAVDRQLERMVGRVRDVWQREGGEYMAALKRLGAHHVGSFDSALEKWLTETLNGRPGVASAVERKGSKLGYARAFLEELQAVLEASAAVLAEAVEESKKKRRPRFDTLDGERQEAKAAMAKGGGPLGRHRRAYRDKSDELAQFHKADIAREVVTALVKRLQKTVKEALDEAKLWERNLGTAKSSEGGAYALIVDGRREVDSDRRASQNAVRWVIADNEPGDSYIEEKRDKYGEEALEEILEAVEWRVGRTGADAPLRIDFAFEGKRWDRGAGAPREQARGQRNVAQLLVRSRRAFEVAWTDMSVTEYLVQNYAHRVEELAQRVYQASGYALATVQQVEPPMRTTFLRVYKEGLDRAGESFLTQLRMAVAQQFNEQASVEARAAVSAQGEALSASGQDSRDMFKLTFVMFGDLLQPEQIKGFAGARSSYHTVSGRGEDWRTLHVLAAETNALRFERLLSTGPGTTQQRRRELDNDVVVCLEDVERFQLLMRCLAYGETDFNWQIPRAERGMLLHRHTPPRSVNPAGLSHWRLTVQPVGERRKDGFVYMSDGRLAHPEYYQLSEPAREPDLVEAFIQFACVGNDKEGHEIDLEWVGSTVSGAEERHATLWSDESVRGWRAAEQTRRDAELSSEALGKAAQVIRLNALVEESNAQLRKHPWAWKEKETLPRTLPLEKRPGVQRYVDLWTAIRWAALEEMDSLNGRLAELGAWRGGTPYEKLMLSADVATEPVEPESVPGAGWICSNCKAQNPTEEPFCADCGEPRPEREETPFPLPEGAWICANCGTQVAEASKFCGECGQPRPKPEPVWTCPKCGAQVAEASKFCGECGQARPGPEPVWTCPDCGTQVPEASKFCSECGVRRPETQPIPRPVPTTETPRAVGPSRERLEQAWRVGILSQEQYEAKLSQLEDAEKPVRKKRMALKRAYDDGVLTKEEFEAKLHDLDTTEEQLARKREAYKRALEGGVLSPEEYEAKLAQLDASM